MTRLRLLMAIAILSFVAAAAVHSGFLISGYAHAKARVAESVIAAVLLAGFALTFLKFQVARRAAVLALSFALIGTFLGLGTIVLRIGPRTLPDIVFHAYLVVLLIAGLVTATHLVPHRAIAR